MRIRINYGFYTDGDFSLREPEKFFCTGRNVEIKDPKNSDFDEYFDYIGEASFETTAENPDSWKVKNDAKVFLLKMLCNGFHVSYTHHYILKDLYEMVHSLVGFIDDHNLGGAHRRLSGNYDSSFIDVDISES